jgi:hypothetical protein
MNKKTTVTVSGIAAILAAVWFGAGYYADKSNTAQRLITQQVLSEKFADHDADRDRYLSQSELTEFARATYRNMVAGDDTPESQPRAEFITLFTKNAPSSMTAERAAAEGEIMFLRADRNHDDNLTEDEYIAFYMNGLKKMGFTELETKGIAILDTGPSAPVGH